MRCCNRVHLLVSIRRPTTLPLARLSPVQMARRWLNWPPCVSSGSDFSGFGRLKETEWKCTAAFPSVAEWRWGRSKSSAHLPSGGLFSSDALPAHPPSCRAPQVATAAKRRIVFERRHTSSSTIWSRSSGSHRCQAVDCIRATSYQFIHHLVAFLR